MLIIDRSDIKQTHGGFEVMNAAFFERHDRISGQVFFHGEWKTFYWAHNGTVLAAPPGSFENVDVEKFCLTLKY